MNSDFLIEKLESSADFSKFIDDNPDAYLCSGFLDITINNNSENKYHFDFYVPKTGKTFSFQTENGIKLVELEQREGQKALEKVSMKNHFDFSQVLWL